jgi:hypothetical protein
VSSVPKAARGFRPADSRRVLVDDALPGLPDERPAWCVQRRGRRRRPGIILALRERPEACLRCNAMKKRQKRRVRPRRPQAGYASAPYRPSWAILVALRAMWGSAPVGRLSASSSLSQYGTPVGGNSGAHGAPDREAVPKGDRDGALDKHLSTPDPIPVLMGATRRRVIEIYQPWGAQFYARAASGSAPVRGVLIVRCVMLRTVGLVRACPSDRSPTSLA